MPTDHEPHRKLAAILSADAVGYSRLMHADEPATVETLNAYRAAMRRVIERHKGRVVNAPGDALLAEFASVVEAVSAAVEIQQALEGRNVELPAERRMHFRIGVNLGDVIEQDDGTIYGDGVNIAARMEALAEAGGVCISSSVYDAVEGKLALGFDFLGEQQVKNIAKPVRVYRVRSEKRAEPSPAKSARLGKWLWPAVAGVVILGAIGLGSWLYHDSGAPPVEDPVLALPKGPSIAVLPFANLSGDPNQEYFADGLTEEIITALTRFRELFVIARNSSFKYKGQALDVRQVARELGVRYVLEGSVRKSPDTIRVTAQLIDATSGAHLWAQNFDRMLTAANILGLQDEITEHVVTKIAGPSGAISRAGLREVQGRGPQDLTAYECVLRAREHFGAAESGLSPVDSHLRARTCLERLVGADPNDGDAWGWLALITIEEHRWGYNPRPKPPALERSLKAAQRALSLDPTNPTARFSLTLVHFFRHELEAFAAEAERALELNPNDVLVLAELGNLFGYIGQLDRSMALTSKAIALNPHHPTWYYATVFNYHYHRREYREALAAAQKWNAPDFYWNQVHLAQAYAQLGRKQEAQAAIAKLLELYPDFASKAREELRAWNLTDKMTEHELEGLRKAGLDVPST